MRSGRQANLPPRTPRWRRPWTAAALPFAVLVAQPASAQVAGQHGPHDLVVADHGRSKAVIVLASDAGPWEKRAAADLEKYIKQMSGADLPIVGEIPATGAAIVLGKAAIAAEPRVGSALQGVEKKHPLVQADAIAAVRDGDRLYLAGSDDESHYFAASWLLQQWGCRWYMPTDFGEVVPDRPKLAIGTLAYAYAPPFEIRHYWLSWNGDTTGAEEFRHRNFMSAATAPGAAQQLDHYTKDIAPTGGSSFNVPFSEPATADHIANEIAPDYRSGKNVSLAIADGLYENDDPRDRALITEYDRSMLRPSLTDAMMTLYNNVAGRLRSEYPDSHALIGGMAYVNVTLPPRLVTHAEPNLVMWIAPIDIDPNHAMDDPRSPPKLAYERMVERWAKLMEGRVAIYDYDQGMLIWRDLPDPSQDVFARDVKIYAKLGILGIGTESRGATATTFLNLFFRGQLMWNPDADVGVMLKAFYPAFYGPAGPAMADYWNAIFSTWRDTGVTEHEAMAAPAIYTPELVARLAPAIDGAEAALAAAKGRMGRDEARYVERLHFTRLSFEIIRDYVAMIKASASDADYGQAVRAGEQAIAIRLQIAQMNPTFTVHVVGPGAEKPAGGAAWLAGEVEEYRQIAALSDGTRGELIAKLPLEWSLSLRDPVPAGWTYKGEVGGSGSCPGAATTTGPPGRSVRTDLYLQAQGVRRPEGANDLGSYCYATTLELRPTDAAGKVHLIFPGLFNEAWLAVDGRLVAHRSYAEPEWSSDYAFVWDVDLTGKLTPGRHVVTLGGLNPLHFAGMFRRPFLYRPVNP